MMVGFSISSLVMIAGAMLGLTKTGCTMQGAYPPTDFLALPASVTAVSAAVTVV